MIFHIFCFWRHFGDSKSYDNKIMTHVPNFVITVTSFVTSFEARQRSRLLSDAALYQSVAVARTSSRRAVDILVAVLYITQRGLEVQANI